jgi:hypothetical protein
VEQCYRLYQTLLRLLSIIFLCVFLWIPSLWADSKIDWPDVTQVDLKFIHSKIKETIPYTFIRNNVTFRQQLEEGLMNSLSAAKTVTDDRQYQRILQNYIQGFHIEHLSIHFTTPQKQVKQTDLRSKISITPFLKNSVWIKLHSFDTYNHPELIKPLQSLAKQMPIYRQKDAVIFDMRHNAGGSSQYSRPLIVALYSAKFLRSLGSCFLWNHPWQTLITLNPHTIKQYADEPNMVNAYKAGEKLYHRSFWPINYGQRSVVKNDISKNPVHAKVIVLSDSSCSSMCYQFVRTLTKLPRTILVGQSPDTMDRITTPIPFELPSHLATVYIASEEFIFPADAFGKTLQPQYSYVGDLMRESQIKHWVSQIILTQSISTH